MLLVDLAERMFDRAVRRPSISSRLLAREYARPELPPERLDEPPPPKPMSGSDCEAIIPGPERRGKRTRGIMRRAAARVVFPALAVP